MIKNESIKKIIAEYEKAFAALGIRKNTEFFADAFISAGPRDAIAQSKAEFLKMHIKPQTSIKCRADICQNPRMDEAPISNEYSMVKVHRGVTSKRPGIR